MTILIKSPCEESAARVGSGDRPAVQRTLGPDCDDPCFQHGVYRRNRRQRRTARLAGSSARLGDGHSMGRRVLRPFACLAAAVGRFSWRSLWPPQDLPLWRSAVCHRDRPGAALRPQSVPSSSPRRSRDRSGAPGSGKSGHYQRRLFRGRARARHRDLVRLHGDHCIHRAGSGRMAGGARVMALGLLHQSSHGGDRNSASRFGGFRRAATKPPQEIVDWPGAALATFGLGAITYALINYSAGGSYRQPARLRRQGRRWCMGTKRLCGVWVWPVWSRCSPFSSLNRARQPRWCLCISFVPEIFPALICSRFCSMRRLPASCFSFRSISFKFSITARSKPELRWFR